MKAVVLILNKEGKKLIISVIYVSPKAFLHRYFLVLTNYTKPMNSKLNKKWKGYDKRQSERSCSDGKKPFNYYCIWHFAKDVAILPRKLCVQWTVLEYCYFFADIFYDTCEKNCLFSPKWKRKQERIEYIEVFVHLV